jgi:hypothetical protein
MVAVVISSHPKTNTPLDCPAGSLQGAAWLQQRWQQAGRPRSLFSASGACLTLHLKRTVFGGLDLGRLGLSSLVAVRGGARLIVEGMDCLGVKGGSCMSVVGAGQVMLRALNISGVQAEGGMAAVQVRWEEWGRVFLGVHTFWALPVGGIMPCCGCWAVLGGFNNLCKSKESAVNAST